MRIFNRTITEKPEQPWEKKSPRGGGGRRSRKKDPPVRHWTIRTTKMKGKFCNQKTGGQFDDEGKKRVIPTGAADSASKKEKAGGTPPQNLCSGGGTLTVVKPKTRKKFEGG